MIKKRKKNAFGTLAEIFLRKKVKFWANYLKKCDMTKKIVIFAIILTTKPSYQITKKQHFLNHEYSDS